MDQVVLGRCPTLLVLYAFIALDRVTMEIFASDENADAFSRVITF
jgi:hypothetical protein